jgi:Peptidase propeptide and YPEB domain
VRRNRRYALVAGGIAAVAALAIGGVGIAQAVSGDSEAPVTGAAAEHARAAALDAAGGGTVLEIEHQDGDGSGVYEVEVRRTDGATVEIHLDGQFRQVGSSSDDDSGAESENDANDD